MTSHLNSHRTTDIKPEMLSGVQTGNGNPTSAKLYIYIGVGSRDLFIDGAHTALDIFHACCLVRFDAFFFYNPSEEDF